MEEDPPAGVPEWVVTYGDMMSLLLTFFIMLVSLSEIVAEQKYRAVLEAYAKVRGYETAPVSPPGQNFPANSHFPVDSAVLGSQSPKEHRKGGIKTRNSVEGDDLRIRVTDEGTPQQVGEALEFVGESMRLTAESESELLRIARELSGKPNKIEIRSHSADTPLAPDQPFEDHIQQTHERGQVVFQLLEQWGIETSRMRITAAAFALPQQATPDRRIPPDRIEILITDVFASDYVGPREL